MGRRCWGVDWFGLWLGCVVVLFCLSVGSKMSAKKNSDFPNFFQVEHPLVASKLSLLRDKHTNHKMFRELINEITLFIGYEATQNLPLEQTCISTPLEPFMSPTLKGPLPAILPILRAGLGMVEGLLSLMPGAKVGHIGLVRDEKTFLPNNYFFKVPKQAQERIFFVCDPMLATGGSAVEAVSVLKKKGVTQIIFLCIVAAPEGVEAFSLKHSDVPIFAASLDKGLDENCYIRPGLGDAGDRLFGTF